MKQQHLEDLHKELDKPTTRGNFYSRFKIGDKVNVKLNQLQSAINGEVVGVSFTEPKVFYDIETEDQLLIRIDSALVGETT